MAFKTSLDVSINVWNEREKKWERAELVPGEEEVIMRALDAIKSNNDVLGALNKEGAILELRGKSVWLSTTNTQIGARLTKVADTVKAFSKNALKSEPQELNAPEAAKKEGGVVIRVRVVPVQERVDQFRQDCDTERAQNEDVQSANELLSNSEWSARLTEGLGEDQYGAIKKALQRFADAQKDVTDIIGEAKRLLDEGKGREATLHYAENMPQAFETYCTALNDWLPNSKLLMEQLGDRVEANPFLFDQNRGPNSQVSIAKTLVAYANQTQPGLFQIGESLKKIETQATLFESTKATVQLARREINLLLVEEQSFGIKVARATEALGDRELLAILKEEGFSDQELENYQNKLTNLGSTSKELLILLTDMERFFELGALKEGEALYKEALSDLIPRYQGELRALTLLQLVAAKRFPDFAPFKLDLSRLDLHQRFLSAIGSELLTPLAKINTGDSSLFAKNNAFKNQKGLSFWERRAFSKIHEGYSKVIGRLYEKEREIAREVNPIKRRALNAQLKQVAFKLTPEVARLAKEFAKRGGEKRLESRGVPPELRNLLVAQREYINDFGERNHLAVRWEDNTVSKTLPRALILDREYVETLSRRGWNQQKIAALNTLYDDFNKALHPIKLAYGRLSEDPENSLLQNQLREIYTRQIDKVKRLEQRLTEMGGVFGIEGLEQGIKEYEQILSTRNLGEAAKPYLRQFDKVNFSATLREGAGMLTRVSQLMKQGLSWEKGYIDHLTNDREMRKLFEGYQYQLRKMNELQRRLEASPSRDRVNNLKSELEYRAYELSKLDDQRERLQSKIDEIPSVKNAFDQKVAFKREAYRFLNIR